MSFRSGLLPIVLMAVAKGASASWFVSADADLRAEFSESKARAMLWAAGLSARKTVSDDQGDRWIAFCLAEAERNFSHLMVHQLYLRHKGPLGKWNLSLGRVGLPFGLLSGYSTARMPFASLVEKYIGFDSDNGLLLSGTVGRLDYGLSATQGLGVERIKHFHGVRLAAARLGLALGDFDQSSAGMSGTWGRTSEGHGNNGDRSLWLLGLDITGTVGRAVARAEAVVGKHNPGGAFTGIFSSADYTIIPKVDLNVSAGRFRQAGKTFDQWYLGLSAAPVRFIIRAGLRFDNEKEEKHEIVLQLYRQFAAAF